ncbi:MAG: cysteine hydrolase [Bryobacterales bacterium]|nr:cysteine hydrolase [Bryobacterales bacterium]
MAARGPIQPAPGAAGRRLVWNEGDAVESELRQTAAKAALIVIDVQKAIDHPNWGRRNNPMAEANIARLLAAWREAGRTVIHVRHHSRLPNSTYRAGQPGCEFKECAIPLPGELVVTKHACNAFVGTDLERILREGGHSVLVVAGVITNNSVEATVRMAGDLGFNTYLVSDAAFTFDRKALDGTLHLAEDVHAHSLANLQGEYASVVETADLLWVGGSLANLTSTP